MSDRPGCTHIAHPYLEESGEDRGHVKHVAYVDPAGAFSPLGAFCGPTVRAWRFRIEPIDPTCTPWQFEAHQTVFDLFWPAGHTKVLSNRCGDNPNPEHYGYTDDGGLWFACNEQSSPGMPGTGWNCRYYFGVGSAKLGEGLGFPFSHLKHFHHANLDFYQFRAFVGGQEPPQKDRLYFRWTYANDFGQGPWVLDFFTRFQHPDFDQVPGGVTFPYEHPIWRAVIKTGDTTVIYEDAFKLVLTERIEVPISGQCCASIGTGPDLSELRCYNLSAGQCVDPLTIHWHTEPGTFGSVGDWCENPPQCDNVGACCYCQDLTPVCAEIPYQTCVTFYNGIWRGIGSECSEANCPPTCGACCCNPTVCFESPQETCPEPYPLEYGCFWTAGVTCDNLDPPCQDVGRCCIPEIIPGTDPGDSDCCNPHPTPGCDDPVCEAAVCGVDPFCCNVEWDGSCVSIAIDTVGCAVCTGSDPFPSGFYNECQNVTEDQCDTITEGLGQWNQLKRCFVDPPPSSYGVPGGEPQPAACGVKCCVGLSEHLTGYSPYCDQAFSCFTCTDLVQLAGACGGPYLCQPEDTCVIGGVCCSRAPQCLPCFEGVGSPFSCVALGFGDDNNGYLGPGNSCADCLADPDCQGL